MTGHPCVGFLVGDQFAGQVLASHCHQQAGLLSCLRVPATPDCSAVACGARLPRTRPRAASLTPGLSDGGQTPMRQCHQPFPQLPHNSCRALAVPVPGPAPRIPAHCSRAGEPWGPPGLCPPAPVGPPHCCPLVARRRHHHLHTCSPVCPLSCKSCHQTYRFPHAWASSQINASFLDVDLGANPTGRIVTH